MAVSPAHRKEDGVLRLLVATDEPALRDLLDAALRADGHEVTIVSSGPGLLDLLVASRNSRNERGDFDLVIADVRMPSAVDVFACVDRGPKTPHVVFINAFGGEGLHEKAEKTAALAVLHEPLDLDELRALASRLAAGTRRD